MMYRTLCALLLSGVITLQANAQSLSKDQKNRLRKELKGYMSDLEGYNSKMQDIRATLDSNEAEIKRMKDDMAFMSTTQVELENKVADFDKELVSCYEENNILKGNPAPGTDPAKIQALQGVMNNAAQKGTVYKVQIGLYKQFNINKYFEQPRYLGYEDVDGMNRYIISYFPEESIAMDFVQDVRKMGIKDAFVAKYIDGVRVYEWSKNPKYKGQPEPSSLQEHLDSQTKKK